MYKEVKYWTKRGESCNVPRGSEYRVYESTRTAKYIHMNWDWGKMRKKKNTAGVGVRTIILKVLVES